MVGNLNDVFERENQMKALSLIYPRQKNQNKNLNLTQYIFLIHIILFFNTFTSLLSGGGVGGLGGDRGGDPDGSEQEADGIAGRSA